VGPLAELRRLLAEYGSTPPDGFTAVFYANLAG
jgi:hypothetical protein